MALAVRVGNVKGGKSCVWGEGVPRAELRSEKWSFLRPITVVVVECSNIAQPSACMLRHTRSSY